MLSPHQAGCAACTPHVSEEAQSSLSQGDAHCISSQQRELSEKR